MTVGYLLQRDSGAPAARNLDFCRLWLIFCNLERSRLIFGAAGPEGGEEPSGAIVLRLIQDPRITDSSSINAVSFHTLVQDAMTMPNQSLQPTAVHSTHVYDVRPRKDKRGVDLISDAQDTARLSAR